MICNALAMLAVFPFPWKLAAGANQRSSGWLSVVRPSLQAQGLVSMRSPDGFKRDIGATELISRSRRFQELNNFRPPAHNQLLANSENQFSR